MRIKAFKLIFPVFLIAGILVGAVVFASANTYLNQGLAPAPVYPVNESGQTYGSGLYATSPETEPDLMKAYGVDGTLGYVLSVDLIGEMPKTPEEAIAQQKKTAGKVRLIPLYDIDGKKIIGEFAIEPGHGTEYK